MDRKQFLSALGTLAVGGTIASLPAFASGCATIQDVPVTERGDALLVRKADVGQAQFSIVRAQRLPAPVYLAKVEDGYTAVLMLCTHKNCVLRPAGDLLMCPCHGSDFSASGSVLSPPAPENLRSFPVRDEGEQLRIVLS